MSPTRINSGFMAISALQYDKAESLCWRDFQHLVPWQGSPWRQRNKPRSERRGRGCKAGPTKRNRRPDAATVKYFHAAKMKASHFEGFARGSRSRRRHPLDFLARFLYFATIGSDRIAISRPEEMEIGFMITLTPGAIAKVKSILGEYEEETGLRIAVVGGGCSGFQYQMTLDKSQREDDRVLDMDGLKVFVDAQSMLYLDGTHVDYVESQSGSGFKFENPNASDSCGCGESFEC